MYGFNLVSSWYSLFDFDSSYHFIKLFIIVVVIIFHAIDIYFPTVG